MTTSATEIVTLSLLRYERSFARWWAFTQMGVGYGALRDIPGLKTIKLLGSGGGNGFSIRPNFGVYGVLAVWEDEAAAQQFFATHPWWARTGEYAKERFTAYLRTAVVHGEWAGEQPFELTAKYDQHAPVAVITRATIRTRYLWHFWRFVPTVSRAIENKSGRRLSVGVGEWPLFMQATFSMWDSSKAMMDYAYNNPKHSQVIRKTRELGWYKEELFARFMIVRTEGSWAGMNEKAATRLNE